MLTRSERATFVDMEYIPSKIEAKWQDYWREHKTYSSSYPSELPKYYVLDMFPYPSGAGLHVGHPLGYIASDIFARYKRHQGFNVLHPMGYDAFGLPAEQYAIQTGQHPSVTTKLNISQYRKQLDRMGFSFDWSREVRTCEPEYYKWSQWIFLQLFNSYFNKSTKKAEPIEYLIKRLEEKGSKSINAARHKKEECSASQWAKMGAADKEDFLQQFRLAFLSESIVNWCPDLGTVLANDEVSNGLSLRGGHNVIQKSMLQWSLRITAYADRLLEGLNNLDWSESIKETQKNWIGKSQGAHVKFEIPEFQGESIQVFTTRPDTIFGVSFIVIAPEHPVLSKITIESQKNEVTAYQQESMKRTERERQTNIKMTSGAFTGAYAKHPISGKKLTIWTSDYVLMGYGTGAIMAVPGHDSRDWNFAKHFNLPIIQVVEGGDIKQGAIEDKNGSIINSDFLDGYNIEDAILSAIEHMKKNKWGTPHVQFRLRDAVFGRQRYWGEPIPIVFRNGVPESMNESELPLKLPDVKSYLPTKDGDPPLARVTNWKSAAGLPIETTTMPGWAASSWYFLRFMDPQNINAFADKEKMNYWNQVDLYVGGSEHSTGHLLYSRFWCNFLNDRGFVPFAEPFKKMINQGMIQGISSFIHRLNDTHLYISADSVNGRLTQRIPVDINLVNEKNELDLNGFKNWLPEFNNANFELQNGILYVEREVEKMSKSKYNVISPDSICDQYGADALRLYEMFLGPLKQSKPWDTNGISGIVNFLRKSFRLLEKNRTDNETLDEKKTIHKLIDKVTRDMDSLSFNTSISAMMIAVNELTTLKSIHINSLRLYSVILSPFAPHLAEELWHLLGGTKSVTHEPFPICNKEYLIKDLIKYPVQFNGKTRFFIEVSAETEKKDLEKKILNHEKTNNYTQGKSIRKVIIVPGRIVNLVVN
jgi:leucyl-tRNA synthetase|tara:strand:+ start:3264 stop:6053 length:2790 start_codon:yes stop_codon:yes gene_type:complete